MPAEMPGLHAHEGKGGVAHVDVVERLLEQRAAVRPGDRHAGPLVGQRGERDLQLRPGDREQHLEVLVDERAVRRRRRHQVAVVAEPPGRAVVVEKAVVAQHQPVARLADGKRGEGVGVDAVEEGRGVRPLHVDLAERRDVGDADRGAHRARLAHIGLLQRLAVLQVGARPLPGADIHHLGAGLEVPVVERRAAERPRCGRRARGRRARRG